MLDQHPWICSNKHDVVGMEEEKKPLLVLCARRALGIS